MKLSELIDFLSKSKRKFGDEELYVEVNTGRESFLTPLKNITFYQLEAKRNNPNNGKTVVELKGLW